jgi:hypothetical protein
VRLVVAAATAVLVVGLAAPRPGAAGSGSWQRLHRPLHLPHLAAGAVCPVSTVDRRVRWKPINIFGGSGIGRGPVYPGLGWSTGSVNVSPDTQYGGPWLSGKLFWYVSPDYRGPVLIRGRQLDGSHVLGFNGKKQPNAELRIGVRDSVEWSGQPPGSRGVASSVRALVPGCYGAQIDGTRFSRVVVFVVVA